MPTALIIRHIGLRRINGPLDAERRVPSMRAPRGALRSEQRDGSDQAARERHQDPAAHAAQSALRLIWKAYQGSESGRKTDRPTP